MFFDEARIGRASERNFDRSNYTDTGLLHSNQNIDIMAVMLRFTNRLIVVQATRLHQKFGV